MLQIADLGRTFGIQGGSVFRDSWKEFAEVVVPHSYGDFVEMSDKVDMVIFGGGADIHPSIYNHKNVASYGVGNTPSSRDYNEVASYRVCIKKEIPVLGICRGAQLSCAMAGGSLIQHVTNHSGTDHDILDVRDNKKYMISSAHHQMMNPGKVKHQLICRMEKPVSRTYMYDGGDGRAGEEKIVIEPEIIYFPDIKSLAVQGHPEFMNDKHPTVVYVRKLVNEFLLGGKAQNV